MGCWQEFAVRILLPGVLLSGVCCQEFSLRSVLSGVLSLEFAVKSFLSGVVCQELKKY